RRTHRPSPPAPRRSPSAASSLSSHLRQQTRACSFPSTDHLCSEHRPPEVAKGRVRGPQVEGAGSAVSPRPLVSRPPGKERAESSSDAAEAMRSPPLPTFALPDDTRPGSLLRGGTLRWCVPSSSRLPRRLRELVATGPAADDRPLVRTALVPAYLE